MMVIAMRSSTIARVSRKVRSAVGRLEPSSARIAIAKAMSVAAGMAQPPAAPGGPPRLMTDRKSTRLNSSHVSISYAVFCLKKKRVYPGLRHETHNEHEAAAGIHHNTAWS